MKSHRATLSALVATGGTVLLGKYADEYDERRQVSSAKQRIQVLGRKVAMEEGYSMPEWLTMTNSDSDKPSKVPFVIAMSNGDNPGQVYHNILGGSTPVLGSIDESTDTTFRELLAAEGAFDLFMQSIATIKRGIDLKLTPPTASARETNSFLRKLPAVLEALREANKPQTVLEASRNEESDEGSEEPKSAPYSPVVLIVRDLDDMQSEVLEEFLRWTDAVTKEQIAHVVLLTHKAPTPQWSKKMVVQGEDFVGVLLRISKGQVDTTTGKQKLRVIEREVGIDLSAITRQDEGTDYDEDSFSELEEKVLEHAGNWWSDLRAVCMRLKERGFQDVHDHEERVALVEKICTESMQEMQQHLVHLLSLDAPLPHLPHSNQLLSFLQELESSGEHQSDKNSTQSAEERELDVVGMWQCLEAVCGMGSGPEVSSYNAYVKKKRDKDGTTDPVLALSPFNGRADGEQMFVRSIDESVLFLQPNESVAIGVVPCGLKELVAAGTVTTRPLVRRAFELLWRDDRVFFAMHKLQQEADRRKMEDEVKIFEEEINERRKEVLQHKQKFLLEKFGMTDAERATREAELSLMDVEISAKEVYLENLRSIAASYK